MQIPYREFFEGIVTTRVVSSEISGGIFPEISGKITVLSGIIPRKREPVKLLHILEQCLHFETYVF